MNYYLRSQNAVTGSAVCFALCPSELDIYKEFSVEAYSIALHPSGLYVLVGFEDKLNLMNLLIDDIKTFQEFDIKSCREV